MSWKPQYAENRKIKAQNDLEYKEKRRIQGETRDSETNKIYMREYHKSRLEKPKRTKEQQDVVNQTRREKYAQNKEYRQALRNKVKQWQQDNPDKRKEQRLRKFGITLDEFIKLFAFQNGKCAICGYENLSDKNFFPVVDHDHNNGKVRGLLCMQCNMGIGKFKDNPDLLRKAALYLEGKFNG